jgi:hypothetical protein
VEQVVERVEVASVTCGKPSEHYGLTGIGHQQILA